MRYWQECHKISDNYSACRRIDQVIVTIAINFLGADMSRPPLLQVVKTVLSAMIGVQSNANRERDFKSGSLGIYVIVGVVMTIAFISTVMLVVSFVL